MRNTEIETLLEWVEELKKITNDEWVKNLSIRKLKELEFHDRDRDQTFVDEVKESSDTFEKFYGNKKFYSITERSTQYMENWIKINSKNKIFLDYACGEGLMAIKAAKNGAKISLGLDISNVSIQNARKNAFEKNIKNVEFFQADAEDTKLPDNSIDTIICSGMLHHLDLSFAFPELRRILKPGGKILALEALDYNPLIKIYRIMTPDMRTEWEKAHILSLKDVDFASRFFKINSIKYWHITAYIGVKLKILKPLLCKIDPFLERVPFLQRMGWMFTFELEKESV